MATANHPAYGQRLLPRVLDDFADSQPNRIYASFPRLATDLSQGFRDVTTKDMARCADVLAHWLQDLFGQSSTFETLSYIGIPDLRPAMVFFAAVKCGFEILFISPKNASKTIMSLLDQTSCSKMLYAEEVTATVDLLRAMDSKLSCTKIGSIDSILSTDSQHYPYRKQFNEAIHDPVVVLHSSGSTGFPKPITMTHGTFSTLDIERKLASVPGRKNRDYSTWDFDNGGGRCYTPLPYFHLSGFIQTAVSPIFTEHAITVLGPPMTPPSGALLKHVMEHQKLRAIYVRPAIVEQLLHEPNALDLFKDIQFVFYAGGSLSQKAAEMLSGVTEVCQLYGSTEAFSVAQLAPLDARRDFQYMEWSPRCKLEMQRSDDEPGTFEMVLFADSSTEKTSALNHNLPGVREWRTKDLFQRHPDPAKSNLWKYYGRRDDIIVLSTVEKFNPVPMELLIEGHPLLVGALVIGQGRSRAALLVEPKAKDIDGEMLIKEIWPLVEEANVQVQRACENRDVICDRCECREAFCKSGQGNDF